MNATQHDSIRLLVVTRESASDARYGLGKSLSPIVAELQARGNFVVYLRQKDASDRSWLWLHRIHRFIAPLFKRILRGTATDALIWALFERLNMGRLAAKAARTHNITHVHCHDPIIAYGFYWLWLSIKPRPRFGITQHGFGCYSQAIHEDGAPLGAHTMRFLRRREAAILARANWVSSPTFASLEQLVRDLSLPKLPTHWHAIPPPRPAISTPDRVAARTQLNIPLRAFLILAVGRLAPLKDFPTLIKGFSRLRALHSSLPLRLVILGDGPCGPLLTLATDLGVADCVTITATDDVWTFYSAADLYVSSSHTESFGLANLEAVAAGVPSICTAVGGVPEVIGGYCRLIPAKNPAVLCSAMSELVTDSRSRKALGHRGYQRMCNWPSVDAIVSQWLNVYSSPHESQHIVPSLEAATPEEQHHDEPCSIFQPLIPLDITDNLRVLVLAPHADDETLGCGGTLAALLEKGSRVTVLVVSDGAQGDPKGFFTRSVPEVRRKEAQNAMDILGISSVVFLDLPDGALCQVAELDAVLEHHIVRCRPDWLFLPSEIDAHADHVAVAQSAKRVRVRACPSTRYFEYEIWAPVQANRIFDITSYFEIKRAALQQYSLPLRYVDYISGIEGLGIYRGLNLPAGRGKAEAFHESFLV